MGNRCFCFIFSIFYHFLVHSVLHKKFLCIFDWFCFSYEFILYMLYLDLKLTSSWKWCWLKFGTEILGPIHLNQNHTWADLIRPIIVWTFSVRTFSVWTFSVGTILFGSSTVEPHLKWYFGLSKMSPCGVIVLVLNEITLQWDFVPN